MPMFMIMPRYSHNYALFYQLLDNNLFTHHIICLSTSYSYHCLFCNLYFPIYTTKIPKIFILLSLSDLTFASGPEGIDNPFIALVARFLIVCVGTRRCACSLLLDWYLGSQKTEGNTYATLLHHPFLFKGKPTHAQEVAAIFVCSPTTLEHIDAVTLASPVVWPGLH